MEGAGPAARPGSPPQSWTALLALYGTVSFVEAVGVSQDGFRPVLAVALGAAAIVLLLMPLSPGVVALSALVAGFAAFSAATSAMVFGLVSVETPSERRSATLNLVYTPLYVAGIIGPAMGAAVAGVTLGAVFVAAAIITAVTTVVVLAWMRSRVAVSSLRR